MAATQVKPVSKIEGLFAETHAKSLEMNERAKRVLPDGVEHDQRIHKPFPIYVERAEGAHKWDVDGNRYVDLLAGFGVAALGHAEPEVTARLHEQAGRLPHALSDVHPLGSASSCSKP